MNFTPQIPNWGLDFLEKNIDKLLLYHSWLSTTGIKTGLISPKEDQFIWDEFIIHSLYFYKLILDLKNESHEIYDLGTGGGIPGVPVGIVSKKDINLIDIKQKRIFELERFILSQNLLNIYAKKEDAEQLLKTKKNTTFLMRCYIPRSNLIKILEKNLSNTKNNTFIISSNSKPFDNSNDMFHVKQEKFFINTNEYRFIDVITVK